MPTSVSDDEFRRLLRPSAALARLAEAGIDEAKAKDEILARLVTGRVQAVAQRAFVYAVVGEQTHDCMRIARRAWDGLEVPERFWSEVSEGNLYFPDMGESATGLSGVMTQMYRGAMSCVGVRFDPLDIDLIRDDHVQARNEAWKNEARKPLPEPIRPLRGGRAPATSEKAGRSYGLTPVSSSPNNAKPTRPKMLASNAPIPTVGEPQRVPGVRYLEDEERNLPRKPVFARQAGQGGGDAFVASELDKVPKRLSRKEADRLIGEHLGGLAFAAPQPRQVRPRKRSPKVTPTHDEFMAWHANLSDAERARGYRVIWDWANKHFRPRKVPKAWCEELSKDRKRGRKPIG